MRRRCREKPFRRSGCATCKARHKKCDEAKPKCGDCERLNLECRPSELFRPSKTSRRDSSLDLVVGLSPGEVPQHDFSTLTFDFGIPVSNADISQQDDLGMITLDAVPAAAVNDAGEPTNFGIFSLDFDTFQATDDAEEAIARPEDLQLTTFEPQVDMSDARWALAIAPEHASFKEKYLLDHYINKASSVLVNVDGPSNPLRNVLIPRAVTSPILMDAVYANAAYHVFVCNQEPEFRIASLAYYDKAASALSHLIAEVDARPSGPDLEILLLTSIFLCKYEIISVGSNWRPHLQGVQKIMSLVRSNATTMASDILSYVKSFIAYHSCIAEITRIDKLPSSPSSPVDERDEPDEGFRRVDPYMGVSTDLIVLLHIAAETAMLDFSKESNLFPAMCTIMKICEKVKSYGTTTSTSPPSYEHDVETVERLECIANAYGHALIMYLHVILDAISEASSKNASLLDYSKVRGLATLSKSDAISACLQDTHLVPAGDPSEVGLVPLLFIIASETKDDTEFDMASTRLSTIFQSAALGNVGMALELLYKMRRVKSLHWRQVLKVCEWDLVVT